MTLERSRP